MDEETKEDIIDFALGIVLFITGVCAFVIGIGLATVLVAAAFRAAGFGS